MITLSTSISYLPTKPTLPTPTLQLYIILRGQRRRCIMGDWGGQVG